MKNDVWSELIQTLITAPLGDGEQQIVDLQKTVWDGSNKDWLLLPSISFHGKFFALVALGREGERRGLEVVRAFFGPRFTNSLKSNTQTLPSGTQIHMRSAILQDDEWARHIAILKALVEVRIGTRPIERSVAQPLSVLLRDFYIAIAAGAEFDAENISKRIEATGLLRGDNIEFLRLHLLASFGHWSSIFQSEKFDDLTRTRRSKVVSEHLLRAIWVKFFTTDGAPMTVDAMRQDFKDLELARKYRDLLGSVAQSAYPEVRTLLALFLGEISDSKRFGKLVELLPDDEATRLESISGLPVTSQSEIVPKADNPVAITEHPSVVLANSGDHLGVIGYFELHPDDEKALGLAIESALELADNEAAVRVVNCIDLGQCEIPNKRILLEALDVLRAKANGFCNGWLEWARRAADESWGDVFQTVSNNANVWDTSWCDNATLSAKFGEDLITAFSGPNSALVQQSTAFILELVGENSSRAAISEVRSAALNVLVHLEMSNAQIRNAFVSLIASYEDGNISLNDYVELLDASSLVWNAYGAVSSFAWFLDVIDQIMQLPRLDDGKLHQLINLAFVSLQSFGDNLDVSLHNLFCEIADPFFRIERRIISVETVGENIWSKFDGLKIGIYSLLDSLPDLRVKLQAVCPGATFVINQDKVASNELRSFAASSNVVVIHTSKAKHPATEELNRHITGQRIYVAGKGRGSIINALLNAEI
jgi:hypothetical protein